MNPLLKIINKIISWLKNKFKIISYPTHYPPSKQERTKHPETKNIEEQKKEKSEEITPNQLTISKSPEHSSSQISEEAEKEILKKGMTSEEHSLKLQPTKIHPSYENFDEKTNNIPQKERWVERKPRTIKFPMEKRKTKKEVERRPKIEAEHIKTPKIHDLAKSRRHLQPSPRPKEFSTEEKREKEKIQLQKRIAAPYFELDLDDIQVFLIIPSHRLPAASSDNFPSRLIYQLELNGETISLPASVKKVKDEIQVDQVSIRIDKRINIFRIIYPPELENREYEYSHSDDSLYVFIAVGSRGTMHYMYDNKGNQIPLPDRDVWIALKDDYTLLTEPNSIEERPLWNCYNLRLVGLKNLCEIKIKNIKTEVIKKFNINRSFSIEGDMLVKDDYVNQMPLFSGNTIKIISPFSADESKFNIWIQNRFAGFKIIPAIFSNGLVSIKLPEDLPCDAGEFQIDICKEGENKPIDTLFFRFVPRLDLKFSNELIFPDKNKGHKEEQINIFINKDEWKLNLDNKGKIEIDETSNAYQLKLPSDLDSIHFSLFKKTNPKTITHIAITIPRLKWRTSDITEWNDKHLDIIKDNLQFGRDFYLIVRSNDYFEKYNLIAYLKSDEGAIHHEINFERKGIDYYVLLNELYDTIKSNPRDLYLNVKVYHNGRHLGEFNAMRFYTKKETSKGMPSEPEKEDLSKEKNIKPKVIGGKRKPREGKGFSEGEIMAAGLNLKELKSKHISLDKRRKSVHQENVKILKSVKEGEKDGNRSS
jgi:ribosomal protein L13E